MIQRFTAFCLFLGFVLLVSQRGFSQQTTFKALEEKVYQLNNALQYNQSQALLLPILQDDHYSADEKYQASLLLSYTYKRVYDYQSAYKFLETAKGFAAQTSQKQPYLAAIQAEEAFILFDTHAYAKAGTIMAELEKNGFRYIDQEDQSKLIMQQGYLRFMGKQYPQAEATYDRAIQLMKAADPCDLPMILVKKMQLYDAMKRDDLMANALKQATFYADSCAIIKYNLYAYEELLQIYRGRKDLVQQARTQQILDSLNAIFAREQNISSLHNQKETIVSSYTNQKLQQIQANKQYLLALLAGVVLVSLGLGGWLISYRRKQRRLEAEYHRMKRELDSFVTKHRSAVLSKNETERTQLTGLSERQQQVLEYMAMGMPNKAIADKLFISENTVKYHIKNIYMILDIKDRKEFLVNVNK